jgi:hypothetical protein
MQGMTQTGIASTGGVALDAATLPSSARGAIAIHPIGSPSR